MNVSQITHVNKNVHYNQIYFKFTARILIAIVRNAVYPKV